jgi:MFS transporter, AAHS family, 4-hydroxybenzoate transporter
MAVTEGKDAGALDVTALIDRGNFSMFQLRIVVLCAIVALLDGADTTSIAIAATPVSAKLSIPIGKLGVIFAASTLGAALGAMAFGPLADRFGRKRLLLVAIVIFGAFTLLTAHADSFAGIMTYRLLAGIGLGGATPCFLALVSEYVPSRLRGTVVSVLWAGFPVGIMVGGFVNSYLVATFGWESIFHVGGVLPIVAAVILAFALPESLQFLIIRGNAGDRAAAIVSRLAPGTATTRSHLTTALKQPDSVPVKQLFTEGRAASTLLLWVPFFMAFGVLAVVVFFTPSLLRSAGGPAAASAGALVNGFHGFGSLLGTALAGRLVQRFGPTPTLGAGLLCGAVCTVGLGYSVASVALAAASTAMIGLFLGFAGSGSIAVATLIYPTTIRATGIGWGMGVGRAGQAAVPLIASWLLSRGDSQTMLLIMAAMLTTSIIAVFFLGRSTGRAHLCQSVVIAGSGSPSR